MPTHTPIRRATAITLLTACAMLLSAAPARALDNEHRHRAEASLAGAFEYLRDHQNEDGSWSPDAGPAVTALVVAGMIASPEIDCDDPAIEKGLEYVLSRQKPDGGIYDQILANYNTSIALMALGRVRGDERIEEAMDRAHDFLRDLQWADGTADPHGEPIDEDHPWYGGAGYGNKGRPDLSNTSMMIAGLNDSGLDCDDPAFQRALSFINRLQGSETNTEYRDRIEPGGGFIYATSTDKDNIGELQSYAVPDEVVDADGRSRLRSYGSMTYAGFMSYLYARLDRDDQRVRDAYNWIRANYTLDENPNTGMQGYYYYLHLFSRGLHAWGEPTITTTDGETRYWTHDLINKLADLQRADGSWVNEEDRWMESDPILCTAYAVLALQHALQ